MKVSIIPIVIGNFGTVTKGMLKGLEDLEVGYHLPTPPLGQDMTQGQFLSGV